MRKILLFLIASAAAYGVIAQDLSDYGRISINAVQPSYDNIPAEASQYLEIDRTARDDRQWIVRTVRIDRKDKYYLKRYRTNHTVTGFSKDGGYALYR